MTSEEQQIIQSNYLNLAKAYQNQMEMRLFSVSLPDLLYTLVFMIFIWVFRVSNDRQIKVLFLDYFVHECHIFFNLHEKFIIFNSNGLFGL